jgi:hypothetical protein
VGGEEAVRDGAQNVLVALRPKVFLLDDEVHEVLLGKLGRLAAAVAVEDAEEGVLEILFVGRRLVRHRENVLHVLAAALVTVAGHAQVDADARRHLESLVDAAPHQNCKQNKNTLQAQQHSNTAMSLRHCSLPSLTLIGHLPDPLARYWSAPTGTVTKVMRQVFELFPCYYVAGPGVFAAH